MTRSHNAGDGASCASTRRARNGIVPVAPIMRLRARLRLDPATGCLEWTGPIDHRGYARITTSGKRKHSAHRLAYEDAKGPIPEGLTLDHLCRNKRCCNPDHLEAVTGAENTRRAAPARGLTDACRAGHPLTAENTILERGGNTKRCRICRNARDRKARSRRRGEVT